MKNKIIAGWLGGALAVWLASGTLIAQDVPEPPEPPEPALAPALPEPPEPPVPPAQFNLLFGEDGARLGARLADVTAEKARELKLSGEYGAQVIDVEEDSPASKAGLAKNDVILEFGGQRVWSVAQLGRLLQETPPGRTVPVQISRGGQVRTLSIKVGKAHGEAFKFKNMKLPEIHIPEFDYSFHPRGARLGITGQDLTRQLAEYFGVKQGKGVLISEVLVGSAAAKAGLKAGDVVVRIDGKDVGSLAELRRALPRELKEERKVALTIVRDRHEQTVTVELQPTERVPLYNAQAPALYGVDPAEFERLADEYRRGIAEFQKDMEKYKQDLQMQKQYLRENLLQQFQEIRDRRLNETRRELMRVRRQLSTEAVI